MHILLSKFNNRNQESCFSEFNFLYQLSLYENQRQSVVDIAAWGAVLCSDTHCYTASFSSMVIVVFNKLKVPPELRRQKNIRSTK